MTKPGIFLNYKGNINCPVIDSLMTELKNRNEFQGLYTPIRKRTYSMIVESIENIYKHAVPDSRDDIRLPEIMVRNEENQIIIKTGNSISEEKREILTKKLEYVNSLECDELKKLHETRINYQHVAEGNGAGLGLISMAIKSGNKLSYKFTPLVPGYLYFELEILLRK